MGSFLVILFWIWCGISLVILIARPFYRRTKSAPITSLVPTKPDEDTRSISAPASPGHTEPARADLGPTFRSSRSVADVLSGIQMPCELAPLTGLGPGAMNDPGHVVFATEGHRVEEVGALVGDELERIGCELSPITATTMRADRGSDSLEICIHPDPATVTDGAGLRFPTAPPGSVVVEFQVR